MAPVTAPRAGSSPRIVLEPASPELFAGEAQAAAERCASKNCNKPVQIRRFYEELLKFHDKVCLGRSEKEQEEKFAEMLPFIQMIRAKAAYARGRKLIDDAFYSLVDGLVREIRSPASLRNAKLFFEAFIGYSKYLEVR